MMKIAISSVGSSMDSMLDVRFGRCKYFQIHDTDSGKVKVIENKGQLSGGGAGIAAAQQLINERIDIIITGSLGPNAFELINKAGIKAYKCEAMPINIVLEKFKNSKLEEIKVAGKAHHGM